MALSYEEIKQKVKDGTYVTKSAQADSKYEAIKQKVKSGYYDFGVDDNFINSYLTSSRNYSQKVVDSYKDVTYSSITSRYENEDAERTKVLRDGDKIQAYLNANKANISEENYNNLSQYIKTNREFLENDGVNLKRFYDQTRGKTADEYNLGLVYGDYGESSYDEIKKAEASATNPEIKAALNTLKLIKISTSTAECNAAIEDVKNQIANCSNEEQKKQLESQLSEYTVMLNGAKAYEAVAEYNSVTQQSDFTEYSQAGAKSYTIDTSGTLADIAESYEEERLKEGFNNQNLVAAFWNILDKYPELAKSDVDIYKIDNNIAPGSYKNFDGFIKAMRGDVGTGGYGGYTFMTENGEVEYAVIGEMNQTERSVYNYLFAKNGVSNADDYLTKLSSCFYNNNLNYRRGKTLYSEIEKGSLGETFYGIKSSLQRHTDDILAVLGGYDDGGYVTVSPRQYAQGMVDENLTGIRQFISDLAGTTAYMIPSIVTSMAATALTGSDQVGSAVGAAVIGLSSSGGAYNEARQLGYSHEEARTYAALTGGSEAVLQYVLGGISKLGGKLTGSGITKLASKFDGAFAKFAINLGGKMASEGLEEYLQEVISPVIKNISFSTDEEIDLLSSDALYAALLGAVSAGLLESVDAYRTTNAEIAFKELIDMGKKASPDSEAYKLANELSDKPISKINPEQINQLSEAVAVEANNNRHKKAAEIESQLVEKGETGDTERIAWAAVNLLSGAKISEVEQNLIKNSPAAKSIISEITGVSANQSTDSASESNVNSTVDSAGENWYNNQAEGSGQLKQNIGVSEADSSESASFMPENESVLPDLSAEDGDTDSYEAFAKRYNGTLELTEDQKFIQSICKALGTVAVFENLDRWVTGKDGKRRFFSPDGYFDKATGKIYINTSTNGKHNPLLFVIKHELTHFGEINKTAYDSFVKAVKKSKEFKAWLEYKTGMKGETTDRMAAKLGADIRDERSKYGIDVGVAESGQEVIANFAGDILFAKSGKTLDSLLNSVEAKQRPKVIQAVVDFFRWLREKLSGNKALTFELQRLESKYTAMLKSVQNAAENTNSTAEGGKEYSAAAASADVLDLVRKVKSGDFKANEKIYFDDVSDELAAKIENLTGINVKGFKVAIEARQIEHILKDHGDNGKSDHSMSSDEDIAKMEYVLKNPDGLSLSGKTQAYSYMKNGHNKTADTVLYDKAIGNKSYYVVQAVPDTKAKTLYVVSAFIGEKGYKKEASQLINAKSPDATAKPGSVVASDNRVAQNEPSVNSNSTQETREYSFSEDVDTEQDTDYTAEFDKVTEQFEKGDITRAEFIEQVKQLYTEAGETYGTIPKGETVTGNENFDNPTPKQVNSNKKVRQFARTIIEGGGLTEEMLSVTKQQILSGELSYTPTSNERNIEAANRAIEGGHADELWMKTVACEEAPNSTTIATGEALLKLAFDRKDTVKAVQLVAELCEVGTRTAQALQAFSLLKRMGGIGQLYYVQKAVNTLNHDLKTRFKDKAPDIKINETLAEQLAESKTEEDFAISYTAIMNDIAAQVPSTFLDKWNAWRYMAMLANPTTHIRNINGNLMFYPFVKTKDVIASGLEHIFLRGDNADKRTKSVIISKDYKQFAKNDFRNVEEIITGSGKMNPKRGIADNRPIFKTKVLESIRKFNFDLLEKEDAIFLKKHYTRALGGYLQAQNIDLKHVSSDTLAKAREYAILEAQKATFRDLNKIANAISRFSNSHLLLNLFVEGVLPFKKTPLNIVKRGIEYSPLGLIKALTKGSYDLKKGNISASQFIDGISGGLTGTGIMLVGMLLSRLGIVKGGFGDDEEDGYNRLMGEQEYSVELFGISYTIDWAAPACIPFFMGVAINESIESEGNYNWEANLGKTALAGLEPIINLSMLSGIQETIASARYADGKDILYNVIGNVIGSYFSQALPTIGGKIANTIDDTRRTNYIDKSSNMPIWVQSAINTVKAKVPGLSMTRPEYVDAWGETQDKGDLAMRIFQNFLSPGYVSSVEVTDIDNELKRLAGETGEQSVFPDRADKKFKFKNYTKYLSADEYVEYATMKGQMSADYINELIHSDGYSSLTDEQKVEVINNLYALANAKAKSRLSYTYEEINAMHDGKITEEMYNKYNDSTKRAVAEMHFLEGYKKPINMENNGYSAVDYYISQAKIKKKK